ncbi:MAG: hypothetical protein ACLFQX_13625 [Candidatus Kapaibacterium sp.]
MKYIIALFLMFTCNSYALDLFDTDKSFRMSLMYNSRQGSSFYNMEGNIKTSLTETDDEGVERDYTFDFSKYSIGLSAEYRPGKHVSIYTEIPFAFYGLTEKFMMESDLSRQVRAELSLSRFDYFALGFVHRLYSGKSQIFSVLELRIPPGFDESLLNDPDYEFLSDGAFEIYAGSMFRADLDKVRLQTRILYNYRAEEFSDRVIISTSAGLVSVEDTELKVTADIVQSLSSFGDAPAFDPRETVTQSNFVAAGFGFDWLLSEKYLANFSYKVRLSGKNAWNFGTLFLSIGVLAD